MSREQERAKRKQEKNPIVECNKIQNKYYPELFKKFSKIKDPRNQNYINYSVKTMLGTLYYKCIGGISSMQEMTRQFNDEKVVGNLYSFIGESKKEYLPHGVTENEFWKGWIRWNWKKYRKILPIPRSAKNHLMMPRC